MGYYKAVASHGKYDVALVVSTPNGDEKYLFGKNVGTLKEADEIAELFNKETDARLPKAEDAKAKTHVMRKIIDNGMPFRFYPEPYPVMQVNDFGFTLDVGELFSDWTLNPAAVVTSLRMGRHVADLMTDPSGNPRNLGILSQEVENNGDQIVWRIEKKGFEDGENTIEFVYDAHNYSVSAIELLVAILFGCDWDRFRYTPFEFMHVSHREFGVEICRLLSDRKDLVELWDKQVGFYNSCMRNARARTFDQMFGEFGMIDLLPSEIADTLDNSEEE